MDKLLNDFRFIFKINAESEVRKRFKINKIEICSGAV